MSRGEPGLASRVIHWQAREGRHGLPWQGSRDPYRVWLSEIMLQQTQVSTVLDYFPRFLERFPDVQSLAAASEDDVLGLWSGLGYYTRARNLHRCAMQVVREHEGRFPATAAQLQTLPGIGRSTAAAIAAFCFGERVAILDGNVKRVLTRVLGFDKDLSMARHEQELWALATDLLPPQEVLDGMPAYTQGLMDLGATVCVQRNPQCLLCPLNSLCVAHASDSPQRFPVKTRKLKRSSQSLWLLWAVNAAGELWLEKRAAKGIWAGLHCLPVFDSEEALNATLPEPGHAASRLPGFLHVLTHKDLHLHPVKVVLDHLDRPGEWVHQDRWTALGLPAPVRKMLTVS